MDKIAVKHYAINARKKLITSTKDKAALIGITEKEISQPVSKGIGYEIYKTKAGAETTLSEIEIKQRENLIIEINKKGFNQVIEEVAYTWFNRIIAIRFMEVNDYLPSRIRALSSEIQGKMETDLMTTPFDAEFNYTAKEKEEITNYKETNKQNELFKLLFIKQCNELYPLLPGLFEQTNDYTELLFSINYTDKEDVVYKLINDINEDNFNVEKEGQIEIIGWMYQYYNTELKATVNARPKGEKICKNDIPAVTQLFTPQWIVKYMVENSLGRLWVEKLQANNQDVSIKNTWKYYLDEAEQEPEVEQQLKKIRSQYKDLRLEEIKLIDPCMGSGHIIVYMFEVLIQLYTSEGWSERDAVTSILQNNIYGLDIDKRAYQLSYFSLMMKARQYDRRILTRSIKPHLYAFEETTSFIRENLFRLGDLKDLGLRVANVFENAKELGSILIMDFTKDELDSLDNTLTEIDRMADYGDIFTQSNSIQFVDEFSKLTDIAKAMSQKYDVVVTNPPYTPISGCSQLINDYAKKYYLDSKTDFFGIFIEKCKELSKSNAYLAMITMHSWMFLSSYEKLRNKLLKTTTIINMAHLGTRAFEEIGGEIVQTTSWVQKNTSIVNYNGAYKRLVNYNSQDAKEKAYLNNTNYYECLSKKFKKIMGSPIAYWVSEVTSNIFKNEHNISELGEVKLGLSPGFTDYFLKVWFEVSIKSIGFNIKNRSDSVLCGKKWFPCNKGGAFRKWYGNNSYVINWSNDGYEIRNYKDEQGKLLSRPQNLNHQFKRHIGYSRITNSDPAFRLYSDGTLFTDSSSGIFIDDYLYTLGFLNSKQTISMLEIINPTMNYQAGDISRLPLKKDLNIKEKVEQIVKSCLDISKEDWDSFEISWDFKTHPLIASNYEYNDEYSFNMNSKERKKYNTLISNSFNKWKSDCNERLKQLKTNEEELNRIFIDVYGLQDELTPDVNDKDVTIRKSDLTRDIKSFISYAVGCMFGRYSLDVEGLAYAGGEWDDSKYLSFVPDEDNIIPIREEKYYEQDDIVDCFVEFVKVVYGEETLNENLNFIAKALGNKGSTAEEVIRNYFVNDFFKEHCQTYQVTGSGKRPIYWLFDSGKQNGFKALVYMHRYNEDTLSKLRTDYLHKVQDIYEERIKGDLYTIENSTNKADVTKARKHMDKLEKQLAETRIYDQALAHKAAERISIDLDDGVKVNYAKFQNVEVINEGSKKIRVDLLAKI